MDQYVSTYVSGMHFFSRRPLYITFHRQFIFEMFASCIQGDLSAGILEGISFPSLTKQRFSVQLLDAIKHVNWTA